MKKSLSKDSRFGSRPATGFTDDLVEMVCHKSRVVSVKGGSSTALACLERFTDRQC